MLKIIITIAFLICLPMRLSLKAVDDQMVILWKELQEFAKEKINRYPVVVGFMNEPPYVIIGTDGKGNSVIGGHDTELIFSVLEMLQIRHKLVILADDIYGSNQSGTWTGFVGHIADQNVDFAVPAISMTKERLKVLEFSLPISQSSSRIIIRKPTFLDRNFHTLILVPFSPYVWLLVAVTLFLTSIEFLIMDYYITSSRHKKSKSIVIFFPVFAFAHQEIAEERIASRSGRFIILISVFYSLLLHSYYTSALSTILMFGSTKLPFNSLEELLLRDDYTVGIVKHSAIEHLISDSQEDPTYLKLTQRILKYNGVNVVNNISAALKKTAEMKFALIAADITAVEAAGQCCQFMFVGEELWRHQFRVAFVTHTYYFRNKFNMGLIALRELGYFKMLQDRYLFRHFEKCNKVNSATRVHLHMIYGLLDILGVGIGVSLSVLFIEMSIYFITKYQYMKYLQLFQKVLNRNNIRAKLANRRRLKQRKKNKVIHHKNVYVYATY